LFVTMLLVSTTSCEFSQKDQRTTEGEATMQPTSLTVTEAARVTAGYVSTILDKPVDPDPAYARKIGCRTDDALMSVGPPWKVQVSEWLVDPAPELVEAALTRASALRDQGFELIPWTRPDPEPADNKSYRDSRGYVVSVKAKTTAGGVYGLDVHATSPCADED
jgi:hypothetical protein